LFSNNWSRSFCDAVPAFPGPADDVNIGNFSVRLTNSASVRSLLIPSTGSLNWQAGTLALGTSGTNQGLFEITAGNVGLSGTINNQNLLRDSAAAARFFNTATIQNSGTMDLQA